MNASLAMDIEMYGNCGFLKSVYFRKAYNQKIRGTLMQI